MDPRRDNEPLESEGSNQPDYRSAMTSPAGNFEPFDDEEEILGDSIRVEDEDEDGEDLIGDQMEK